MQKLSPENITQIIKSLNSGLVVALPTETVYGLAISLNSASALEKLIFLKKREIGSGKVFTLVPESRDTIPNYARLNKASSTLVNKYVPGEITLILPRSSEFRHPYFDHFHTIGIRIPKHPLFSQILKETGPLLLTSANPRGDTPATTSNEVKKSMPKVDVLVTGTSGKRDPSTIVDCTSTPLKILRQGTISI